MAADTALNGSSDRRQWQKVFNALVRLLQTKQTQLEDLVKERNFIEERVKIQFDRWVSEVHRLEDQIFQLKRDHSEALMDRFMEVAKSELVVSLKHRQSLLYKKKLEDTESDLEDFKLCFDYLTHKCSEQKEKSGDKSKDLNKGNQGSVEGAIQSIESTKILEGEIRKLKRAYEKLTSKNNSEVSALLSERNFVWNQFKKMENDYTGLLKNKQIEVERANENIEKLLTSMEQLQSSNSEKDETIMNLKANLADEKSEHIEVEQAKEKIEKLLTSVEQLQLSNHEKEEIILKLKANLTKLEDDTDKSQKEISRLSKELDSLRSSRGALGTITPVLTSCRMASRSHSAKSQKSYKDRTVVKKESAFSTATDVAKNHEKGSSGSRKRGVEAIRMSETPRLFSATFKVPKLKNCSPRIL